MNLKFLKSKKSYFVLIMLASSQLVLAGVASDAADNVSAFGVRAIAAMVTAFSGIALWHMLNPLSKKASSENEQRGMWGKIACGGLMFLIVTGALTTALYDELDITAEDRDIKTGFKYATPES